MVWQTGILGSKARPTEVAKHTLFIIAQQSNLNCQLMASKRLFKFFHGVGQAEFM